MGKQKQKSKAPEQMNEKCYLLKVVAEQNRERILDYDVDQDTVKIYCIVDGQFKTLHEVPDYIKGDGFGKYFIDPEDIDNYRKALEVCLTEPCSQLVDVRYHDKGAKNEWYRAYLNSLTDDKGEIVRIVGRLMSVQEGMEWQYRRTKWQTRRFSAERKLMHLRMCIIIKRLRKNVKKSSQKEKRTRFF